MGGAASAKRGESRISGGSLQDHPQAVLLVNGSVRRVGRARPHLSTSGGALSSSPSAIRSIDQRQKKPESSNDEEMQAMRAEADPATLQILNAVREADGLSKDQASLKLQLLRDCYSHLEKVPQHRFDHLAVLVYQKEGDVYFAQGDVESAKTTYSRVIQIAETHVARGEKEIYMVLKRYVRAMVGMARLWYEQERNTTGFTFADKTTPSFVAAERSEPSTCSRESSVCSEASAFSVNQEILNSMAPRPPRRRVGPTVRVCRLLRPTVIKQEFTEEDNFVLRSQMRRELKASSCELLLLRCIQVVELGHRRQSELLIPALIELAQIYEDLKLYNRSLLLVRRCLGILSVVYDYDHPWIIQLRCRADHLIELMDMKLKESMATKIKATWKMYKKMRLLEEALGRPVKRHVWIPAQSQEVLPNDSDFLKEFLNDLPDGTVLCAIEEWDEGVAGPSPHVSKAMEEAKSHSTRNGPHPLTQVSTESHSQQTVDVKMEKPRVVLRRSTLAMNGSAEIVDVAEGGLQVSHKDFQPTIVTTHVYEGRFVDLPQESQSVSNIPRVDNYSRLATRTTTTTTEEVREYVLDTEDVSIDGTQKLYPLSDEAEKEEGVLGLNGPNYEAQRVRTVKTASKRVLPHHKHGLENSWKEEDEQN